MFEAVNISCETGKDVAYYKNLVEHSYLLEYRKKILRVMYESFASTRHPRNTCCAL